MTEQHEPTESTTESNTTEQNVAPDGADASSITSAETDGDSEVSEEASGVGESSGEPAAKKKRKRKKKTATPEGAQAAPPRRDLPFSKLFGGEARKHPFSAGEVVAGRVVRIDGNIATVDLFGKALAFVSHTEVRDIEMPAPDEVVVLEDPHDAQVDNADGHEVNAEPAEPSSTELSLDAEDNMAAAATLAGTVPSPENAELSEPLPEPEEAAAVETQEQEGPPLTEGDVFRGRVVSVSESGHIALFNRLRKRPLVREQLAQARAEHRRVFGIVFGFNRGGFDVLVDGIRAFCPVSGLSLKPVDSPFDFLGARLEFSVQQTKSGHQGIVVSRRSILEREQRRRAKELRKTLEVGAKVQATISHVRDFGWVVDLGGLEGIVFRPELDWDRNVTPASVGRPGDVVELQVLKVGRDGKNTGRVELSRKALQQDPWLTNLGGIEEGVGLAGKVTRTTDFGAFIELAPNVEGLLHITEIGQNLQHASEKLSSGQEVLVVVDRFDPKARRISLSLMGPGDAERFKNGEAVRSQSVAIRVGNHVKVRVEKVDHGGVAVQLDGVVGRKGRGFIPNAEMATEKGADHRKKFPAGMVFDAKIISIERDGSLKLSRKGFMRDEERNAIREYRKEAASQGLGTFGDLLRSKLGN